MLYDMDRLLRQHGVMYWITRSTLYGAIKVGGLLKDDRDIDICIPEDDVEKLLSINLEKCGYKLSKTGENYKISSVKRKDLPVHNYSCCPYVDIHIMHEENGKFFPYHEDTDYFEYSDVFPLKRIPMQSFLVFSPQKAYEYLERTFKYSKPLNEKLNRDFKVSRRVCLDNMVPFRKGTSPLNKFFDRIFVINLHDQRHRLDRFREYFQKYDMSYSVFDAIDGRCKTKEECKRKRLALEREYHVRIPKKMDLPPASLTLGTYLILKESIKRGWNRIAIFEDDAVPDKNFNHKFSVGISELRKSKKDWDLLYLGCTQFCGTVGISDKKSAKTPNLTTIHKFNKDVNFYVKHPWDIRTPCPKDECTKITTHLSDAPYPGGTFGYGVSRKGMKKILKIMNGRIYDHIDGIYRDECIDGNLDAIAFDPPIIYHHDGAERADSNIDWDWD